MTEKKRLPEQIASHTYRQVPLNRRRAEQQEGPYPVSRQETSKEATRYGRRSLQRVVTVPNADPSTAWNTFAERQEQRRRARARPPRLIQAAPRTQIQTGMRASSGRIKVVKRSLQQKSPIPARSGRRAVRRGFLWKLLGMFALSLLILLAVNFALTSNAFRVAQVNVVGVHNDALMRVIQSMGMQGQNIFLISVVSLTDRIDALPLVESVSLSKQFPNQLTVSVVERVPVALWQTTQGTFSVDSQGVVMATLGDTPGADHLPLVTVLNGQGLYAGQQPPPKGQLLRPGMRLDPAEVSFVAGVFARLPKVAGITAFRLQYDGTMYASTSDKFGEASGKGSYIIQSPDGWQAYLGGVNDANPLDNRLMELRQILAQAQKDQLNLATIDLRYGLRPVYTLKR